MKNDFELPMLLSLQLPGVGIPGMFQHMFGFLLDFHREQNALWDNQSRGVRHEFYLSKVFLAVWRGEGRGEEKSGDGLGLWTIRGGVVKEGVRTQTGS